MGCKIGRMQRFNLGWADPPLTALHGGALTLGNFDGVHRGHAALVAAARAWGTRLGGPTVAMTFDPPPVKLLAPERLQPSLMTLSERISALGAAGADAVVVLKTDPGLLALSAESFFEDVFCRQLGARAIVEGPNFRFGRARGGTPELLREWSIPLKIQFEQIGTIADDTGEMISSTRVRSLIVAGEIEQANALLTQPFRSTGIVVGGAQRGRTIGFPTANLDHIVTLIPAEGVYAASAIHAGQRYAAAVNVGPNPTFGEMARKIEVHLLDFAGDLYGHELSVEWHTRLRLTRPFASVGELVAQLQTDVAAVRRRSTQGTDS